MEKHKESLASDAISSVFAESKSEAIGWILDRIPEKNLISFYKQFGRITKSMVPALIFFIKRYTSLPPVADQMITESVAEINDQLDRRHKKWDQEEGNNNDNKDTKKEERGEKTTKTTSKYSIKKGLFIISDFKIMNETIEKILNHEKANEIFDFCDEKVLIDEIIGKLIISGKNEFNQVVTVMFGEKKEKRNKLVTFYAILLNKYPTILSVIKTKWKKAFLNHLENLGNKEAEKYLDELKKQNSNIVKEIEAIYKKSNFFIIDSTKKTFFNLYKKAEKKLTETQKIQERKLTFWESFNLGKNS